jgi:ribosomal protein L37AE/L43A
MIIDLDDIRSGETKRGNCPKCHRYNTFTLSREGNTIKWNCYSASCSYSGIKNNPHMSLEDIRFNYHQQQRNKTKGTQNVRTTDDPLERRVAFMIQKDGENVDAIGRALDVWRKPKWKRYNDIDTAIIVPFDAPPQSNLIIVEDIISAWKAVTYLEDTDAMPLLGTSLSTNNLNKIWNTYNSVTIALDKDATDKAINMSRRIFVGVDKCKVVALELDVKDMTVEEIQNVGISQGTMRQGDL